MQVECENLGREIAERAKRTKNLDSQTQRLEAEKIDVDHKLQKLREQLESNQHDSKHYGKLRGQLKLHDIESLENGLMDGEEPMERESEQLRTYDEEDLGMRALLFI